MTTKEIRLDLLATRGVLSPCKCGSAYEVLASVLEDGGIVPIFNIGCVHCGDVYKSARNIGKAVDNFLLDVKGEKWSYTTNIGL